MMGPHFRQSLLLEVSMMSAMHFRQHFTSLRLNLRVVAIDLGRMLSSEK